MALAIGAILPDLIDKPLMLLRIENGRGFAHTLLFALISFLAVFLLFHKKKSLSYSFFVGVMSHLMLDLPYVPLFYPFIYYDISFEDYPFDAWYKSYTDPFFLTTEILGLVILGFIMVNNKLYSIPKIWNYLNNNSAINKQVNQQNLPKTTHKEAS